MIKKVLNVAIVCILLSACNSANRSGGEVETADTLEEYIPIDATTEDGHNAQNALDVEGVYKGVLPCADCEGIDMEIDLMADSTYLVKTTYLGKGDGKPFEDKGVYSWVNGSTIEFKDVEDGPRRFFVGENMLKALDTEGNEITGPNADHYILKK